MTLPSRFGTEITQIIIDPYEVRFLLVSNHIQVELRSVEDMSRA
jgi:hypothetical protein